MERDIRFRAYHPNTKTMFSVFSFCDEFVKVNEGGIEPNKYTRDNFEPLMQSTGMKDAEGIFIYDGDILCAKDSIGKDVMHIVFWDDFTASFKVQYIDQSELPFKTTGNFNKNWIAEFDHKVIGNIHQNPELLSPTK